MKLRDGFDDAVARGVEPGAIYIPGVRQRDYRGARGGRGDVGLAHSRACDQIGGGDAELGFSHQQGDAGGGVGGGQDVQAGGKICGGLSGGRRPHVQDHAAADGDDGGKHADDKTVAGKQ